MLKNKFAELASALMAAVSVPDREGERKQDAMLRLEEALEEYVDERIEKARSEAATREFDARD